MSLRLLLAVALFSGACSVSAGNPSLGRSPADFRSTWGAPTQVERLTRTATMLWKSKIRTLSPNIAEAEVAFLDGNACQIILRSRRPLSRQTIAELGKALVPSFRSTGIPTPKILSDGARTYALPGGGLVTVWADEKPAVMVIRGVAFVQNKEVFDREAAKVRPPTASH